MGAKLADGLDGRKDEIVEEGAYKIGKEAHDQEETEEPRSDRDVLGPNDRRYVGPDVDYASDSVVGAMATSAFGQVDEGTVGPEIRVAA